MTTYDTDIIQGDTFLRGVTLTNNDPDSADFGDPIDLTGKTLAGELRRGSSTPVDYDIEVLEPQTAGKFTFGLTATVTGGLAVSAGSVRDYRHAIKLTDGETVTTVLRGTVGVADV